MLEEVEENMRALKTYLSELTVYQLLLCLALTFIPGIGLHDFYTRGEAREALMVADIVKSGEWILPRGYDNTITTKPPLLHWMGAIFSHLLGGTSAFAVRLPSAIFCFLTLLGFIVLLKRELNEKGKVLFVILLALSFEWMRASLTARVDMVHAACLSLGFVAGFLAVRDDSWGNWLMASILLGLATLGKGPVALVLATIVLSLWVLLRSEHVLRSLVKLGLALFGALIIGALWYVPAYLQAPDEFWAFFYYENVERFTSSMEDKPHQHSFIYLIGMFFLGLLPWSLALLPVAVWAVSIRSKFRGIRSLPHALRYGDPLLVFACLAALVVFLFYAVPSSKRGVYLLACYPFVALACALVAQARISDRALSNCKAVATVCCALIIFSQVFVLPFYVAPSRSERKIAEFVKSELRPGENVFSYEFAFYGASFYSGTTFYALRTGAEAKVFAQYEQLKRQPPIKPGDLVVVRQTELAAVSEVVLKRGLRLEPAHTTLLGREQIVIARAL